MQSISSRTHTLCFLALAILSVACVSSTFASSNSIKGTTFVQDYMRAVSKRDNPICSRANSNCTGTVITQYVDMTCAGRSGAVEGTDYILREYIQPTGNETHNCVDIEDKGYSMRATCSRTAGIIVSIFDGPSCINGRLSSTETIKVSQCIRQQEDIYYSFAISCSADDAYGGITAQPVAVAVFPVSSSIPPEEPRPSCTVSGGCGRDHAAIYTYATSDTTCSGTPTSVTASAKLTTCYLHYFLGYTTPKYTQCDASSGTLQTTTHTKDCATQSSIIVTHSEPYGQCRLAVLENGSVVRRRISCPSSESGQPPLGHPSIVPVAPTPSSSGSPSSPSSPSSPTGSKAPSNSSSVSLPLFSLILTILAAFLLSM